MSSYSDYANAAAEILTNKGAALGQAAANKGNLWGSTIANLGQVVPQQVQQVMQQVAEKKKAAQIQQILAESGGDLGVAGPRILAIDPAMGQKILQVHTEAQSQALKLKELDWNYAKQKAEWADQQLGSVNDEDSYGQFVVSQKVAGRDVSQFPPHYDPNWIKQQKVAHLSFKDQLELDKPVPPKPPGTRVMKTTKDGVAGEIIVEDKPGEFYPSPTTEQKPTNPPNVGSFEDYVIRRFGEKPTDGQILQARKDYNQSDDRPRVTVAVGPNGGIGTLDDDGLELAAVDYRLTHRLPARNAEQNGAIISRAAKQAKALGQTPVATIQKQAAYAGDAKALAKMQGMSAAAEAFESKALAQTDIIRDLSKKVPRTSYPIINSALQSGRTKITGDENATQLANAIETFSEEYAKIMQGTTGGASAATDSARSASKRLINTAMSQGQMNSVLDLMTKEMGLTLRGYDAVIDHITNRMGGSPAAPALPSAPATPTPSKDPLGIR